MENVSDIFSCQQCGYCCQGKTTVSLDAADQERMIRHLGMTRDEVSRTYWRCNGNSVQMKTVDGHCIFYDKGCTIHEGKPWRCTQWPLHPSMLDSEGNFEIIRDSCPGISREVDYHEFCRMFAALLDRENRNGRG
jgi:Fe-S-cluster containining protein